jgi:hypothetical protein
MAATKDEYLADIEAMRVAIAEGVRQVTIGGKTLTYNTSDSLIKARQMMIDEMNRLYPAENKRSRRSQGYHGGRGFC